MRVSISLIGSSQPIVAEAAARSLDELSLEMARSRCLRVKDLEIGGSLIASEALVSAPRCQLIAVLAE